MTLSLLALLAFASLAAVSAPRDTMPATRSGAAHQEAAVLDGHWDGVMTVPGGVTVPFQLDILGTGGSFAAPDMDVSGVPIEVVRAGTRVTIRLPKAGATFQAALAESGDRFTGDWSQGDRSFPAVFTRGGGQAAERPQTPRAPFPYGVRDVSLAGGDADVRLAGTLNWVEGAASQPAVLLLGGNGPHTRDGTFSGHRPVALIADRLARVGIASLRYDKRGAGSSTGAYNRATGDDLATDAAAAFTWLRDQPEVDRTRVCVLGWSEGALIALIISAETSPACIVLLSPPGLKGPELVSEQARLRALAAGGGEAAAMEEARLSFDLLNARAAGADASALVALARERGRTEEQASRLAREFLSPEIGVFLELDPAVTAASIRAPVLIVAGTLDQQTPPGLHLPPLTRAMEPNVRVRVSELSGLNHALQPAQTGSPAEYGTISSTMDERALHEIAGFVVEQLERSISVPGDR